ncbi:MAG: rRNA pseudouridine synthase [Acidobacteria bacterium]|nr:rRNA pseudouridine synthase [Acidobacteriota bacterium]
MLERLQKIIAAAGVASRRKAEELIAQGQVTVNGRVARRGEKADPEVDSIKVAGRRMRAERKVYLALNKPRNCLTTLSDPQQRPTVRDLVDVRERVVPAGRLDYQSEGLVLLTKDGDLVRGITRAGKCAKVYLVKLRGELAESDRQKLEQGIRLEGKQLAPCRIVLHKPGANCWYQVTLFQGVHRQIRRMFARAGHPVSKIKRIAIGPVKLGALKPGRYRRLEEHEVVLLKRLVAPAAGPPAGRASKARARGRRRQS